MKNIKNKNYLSISITELSELEKAGIDFSLEGPVKGIESHKYFFTKYIKNINNINNIENVNSIKNINKINNSNNTKNLSNYSINNNLLEIERLIEIEKKITYEIILKFSNVNTYSAINFNPNVNTNFNNNVNSNINNYINKNINLNSVKVTINGIIDCIDHNKKTIIELKTVNLKKLYNYFLYKNLIKNNFNNNLKYNFSDNIKSLEIFLKSNINNSLNNTAIDKILNRYKFQLFCYGYIYYKSYQKNKDPKKYKLQLILFDPLIDKTILLNYFPDYRKFFPVFKSRIKFFIEIKQFESLKYIHPLKFAYPKINSTQQEILNKIITNNNKYIFIEAPFGSGKTTISIYSILKKYIIQNDNTKNNNNKKPVPKIIFLTSRNIQKDQVYNEGIKYNLNSLKLYSIEQLCKFKYPYCIGKKCKYFPDNISKLSIYEFDSIINQKFSSFNNTNFKNKNTICIIPFRNFFYKFYDLIISDYNNLFFNNFNEIKNTILIIDEFHSFLKRLKEFFTIKIQKNEINNFKEYIYRFFPDFKQNILETLLDKKLFNFNNEFTDFIDIDLNFDLNQLNDALNYSFLYMSKLTDNNIISIFKKYILPFLRKIEAIIILFNFDIKIATFKNNTIIYTFKNLKTLFSNITSNFKQVISISATLNPKNLIYELIDENKLSLFTLTNQKEIEVVIKQDIETVYKKRKYNYTKIVDFIKENIQENHTYMLFFPSFKFIDEIEIFFYNKNINKIILNKNKIKNDDNNIIKSNNFYKNNFYANRKNIYDDIFNILEDKIISDIDNEISNNIYNKKIYNKKNNIYDEIIDNIYDNINSNFSNNSESYNILKYLKSKIEANKINLIFVTYNSIFSEGVNFEIPISSIFCIGLPYTVPEEKYITHYHILKEQEKNPFEILSLFPAINEILQVSGRIGRKYNISAQTLNQKIFFIGKDFLKSEVYKHIENYYKNIKII